MKLSNTYYEYLKWSLQLQKALHRNKISPCPELISEILSKLEEPAARIGSAEKEYAQWVLNIHHPENGFSFKELTKSIKNTIEWGNDPTKYCALRAAIRGRMHFSPYSNWKKLSNKFNLPLSIHNNAGVPMYEPLTLFQQKDWVAGLEEDFMDEYRYLYEGLIEPDYYPYNNKIYYELPAYFKWSLTGWDGPMTGIASYLDLQCYAYCHQSPFSRSPRYYWLYPLNRKEIQKEHEAHELWKEYYGWNTEFGENGFPRSSKPNTWQERWWQWTRKYKSKDAYDTKLKNLELDRKVYLEREAIGFCTRFSLREHQLRLEDKLKNPSKYKDFEFRKEY